jgi:hypothetical protein
MTGELPSVPKLPVLKTDLQGRHIMVLLFNNIGSTVQL